MSEYYAVILHIDRCPNPPDNPEAIGDSIVVTKCNTIEGAQLFIRGLRRMATKIQGANQHFEHTRIDD